MFLIRQAGPKDFAGVWPLAKMLDSYNLPADRVYVRGLLQVSRDSFLGKVQKAKAKYLFVLESPSPFSSPRRGEGRVRGRIVGCSLIIAKHGTRRRPHLWFAMDRITKRSRTLRIRRSHEVLRLGSTEDGPTQVGGLAVLPGFRDHPAHCGLQLSYVRFLYMAMHPQRFEKRILVEYRGLSQDGQRSPFWDAVGHIFTGLSYKQADRLSVANKEFILGLMPREPIYCQLLPKGVQQAIGAVHPGARKAVRLLERIGFHPIPQVEPFDAGRYYAARLQDVRIVRKTRRLRVSLSPFSSPPRGEGRVRGLCLIGTDRDGFKAALAQASLGKADCRIEPRVMRALGLKPGDSIYACPI